MEHVALADKLWDMANYVTGFAVAQVLATTFGIAKKELKAIKGPAAHLCTFAGTIVFTALYIVAIRWCGYRGMELDNSRPEIWHLVTVGRITTVVLFTLVLVMALIGHWHDEQTEKKHAPQSVVKRH